MAKRHGLDVVSIDEDPADQIASEKTNAQLFRDGIGTVPDERTYDAQYQSHYTVARRGLSDIPHLVIGDANRLPFEDESFDLVLSTAGPLVFRGTDASKRQALLVETMRIVRRGGECRFGPVDDATSLSQYSGAGFDSSFRSVDVDGLHTGYVVVKKA